MGGKAGCSTGDEALHAVSFSHASLQMHWMEARGAPTPSIPTPPTHLGLTGAVRVSFLYHYSVSFTHLPQIPAPLKNIPQVPEISSWM